MEQKPVAYENRLPHLSSKYPWLVAQKLNGTGNQRFYTIPNQLCHYRCQIQMLRGRRIRGYFHGWVILSNKNLWSIWNPVTSKIINLPPLTLISESIDQCCLSSPPDDPISVLLLTIAGKPTLVYCPLGFKRKGLNWTRMPCPMLSKLVHACFVMLTITGKPTYVHYGGFKCPTCYNGKIYALCGNDVIQIDIVVQHGEVLVKLLPFMGQPYLGSTEFPTSVKLLKGSGTELFFIEVAFNEVTKKTLGDVYLFELDMSSMRWEEIVNIEDDVFYVDLAHDYSVYYNCGIVPELGGYIHIRDETGKIMYSYDVEDRTISISSVAFPTSHVSMWECSLEGDYDDSEVTQVCKKEEVEDDKIVVRLVTDDEAESHLLNLPLNLLKTIIDHCIGVEYMSFRATCKRCHLAAPSINWSNQTALSRLQKYSLASPWLMVVDEYESVITFTDPISGDKYFMERLHDSVRPKRILCSRFGWLLLLRANYKMVFLNPFTSDRHVLPDFRYMYDVKDIDSSSFSAPPTSPDCMVVAFTKEDSIYINFVARKQRWVEIRFHIRNFRFPTFHGPNLYVLHDRGIVYVLKNVSNLARVFSFSKVANARSCEGEYYLVKCDQQVLLVIVGVVGEYVEVYKLNDHNKDWEKINSIGKYTMYICGETCLCLEAKTTEMEDKIFFPRLHSKNGKIVFYSLETCRYHIFNGKKIEETGGFGIKQTYNHAWVEPTWS